MRKMYWIVFAAAVLFAWSSSGSVIRVPSDYATIQEGLDAAANGDTVIIASGVYSGEGNRDLDFKGKLLTVKSENGPVECTIRCGGSESQNHRAFYFHNGENIDTVVDGFTIMYGHEMDGAGIYCINASPTIKNCIFMNCEATRYGGGINLWSSSCRIFNCIFDSNSAEQCGGGLYATDSHGHITNCRFMNCSAQWGGGLFLDGDGIHYVNNCLMTGNSASSTGAAIACAYGVQAEFLACTATGNSSYFGAGFYVQDAAPSFTNGILWNDVAKEIYLSGTASLTVSYSDVIQSSGVYAGTGNINLDPLFISPQSGDYHLSQTLAGQSTNSPCIDAGRKQSSEECFLFDQGTKCMSDYSTRSDNIPDVSISDMGFHYAAGSVPPTPTPSATSTPAVCDTTGVSVWMPSHLYHAGEDCACSVTVCNATGSELAGYPLFVILDVFGSYFCAPSFGSFDNYLDDYSTFPEGNTSVQVLPHFSWPDNVQSASGITWIAAMTDPGMTVLLGEMGTWMFGWE